MHAVTIEKEALDFKMIREVFSIWEGFKGGNGRENCSNSIRGLKTKRS